ncbi:MAG TPA: hypothetical protein VIF62_31760 [Labilithrix sp.]
MRSRSPFALALLASMTSAGAAAFVACDERPVAAILDPDAEAPPAPPPPPQMPPPPPVDAGQDAGLDCTKDFQPDGLPVHLACTGLYADFAAKTIAAENVFYKPANEFWSDGAEKRRFLYLPPGATIDITDFDAWKMPNGTKVWKEFTVDGKLTETRIFWKSATGTWNHTAYVWNEAATDAIRNDYGVLVAREDGGAPYEIPNNAQCTFCHDNRTDELLGVDALGLGLPGAQGVTLATLAAANRFSSPPPTTSLALPEDATGKAVAALSFVQTNCGGVCHQQGGFAGVMNMRIYAAQIMDGGADAGGPLDIYTNAVCQDATTRGNPFDGGTTIRRIEGGDPTDSLLSYLSGRRVPNDGTPSATEQMPPLVTRRVPTAGHQALDDWIAALPPCP